MKKLLLNMLDPQKPVYEVDFTAKTFRLLRWDAHGADRLPDLRGKLRRATDFKNADIFKEVAA